MARAACGGVHPFAADELDGCFVVGSHAFGEGCVASARVAHRVELGDVLGDGYEGEDVVERLALERGVQRGDDDRLPHGCPSLAAFREVAEELALVDAHDVERVHDVVHILERARRVRYERLAVVRDDAAAEVGGVRGARIGAAGLILVPGVTRVLDDDALLVGHLVTPDPPRELRGLAGEHRACVTVAGTMER